MKGQSLRQADREGAGLQGLTYICHLISILTTPRGATAAVSINANVLLADTWVLPPDWLLRQLADG